METISRLCWSRHRVEGISPKRGPPGRTTLGETPNPCGNLMQFYAAKEWEHMFFFVNEYE